MRDHMPRDIDNTLPDHTVQVIALCSKCGQSGTTRISAAYGIDRNEVVMLDHIDGMCVDKADKTDEADEADERAEGGRD